MGINAQPPNVLTVTTNEKNGCISHVYQKGLSLRGNELAERGRHTSSQTCLLCPRQLVVTCVPNSVMSHAVVVLKEMKL